MKKYTLFYCLLGTAAVAEPLEEIKALSSKIFVTRRTYLDKHMPDSAKHPLQAQGQKGINILNGTSYGISATKAAEADDYVNVLNFLYQSNIIGRSFIPDERKSYQEHEKKHLAVLGIMQQGVHEILADYTVGVKRRHLFERLRHHKDMIFSYGLDIDVYLSQEALKILFPKGFFSRFAQLGCNKDKEEDYQLALAIKGQSYTIDPQHFFYPHYNQSVTVSYRSQVKGIINHTTKSVIGPYGLWETKDYYYKRVEPASLYDKNFLTPAFSQESNEKLYQHIPSLTIEKAIAHLAATFKKESKISFPFAKRGRNLIPYNFKATRESQKTTEDYLTTLFSYGVNLQTLKAAITHLNVKQTPDTLRYLLKLIDENLRKGIETLTLYSKEVNPKEDLYRRGLAYRNEGQLEKAIKYFQPLAEKNFVKAQHNLAMCYYNLKNEREAYEWFRQAGRQGFQPSLNNLRKFNLIELLLPDELLTHIATFLPLESIVSFSVVSSRMHRVVSSLITYTNFLTSDHLYAKQFMERFQAIQFTPMPKEIRLLRSVKTTEGSIEVHFRDSNHLRAIVETTPRISARRRIIFVRDNKAENDKEIIPIQGILEKERFVHIVANEPIKLTGTFRGRLKAHLQLPKRSNFNGLKFQGKTISWSHLDSYENAHTLAHALETFDLYLVKLRTQDAYKLMAAQQASRHRSPEIYPDLLELCPDFCLISTTITPLTISQTDYIACDDPFIYMAKTQEDLKDLRRQLPESSNSISFIDSSTELEGIYCEGPLYLQKGFEVTSEGDITLTGTAKLYDHSLKIRTGGSLWNMGTQLLGVAAKFQSKEKNFFGVRHNYLHHNVKPQGMPENHWQLLLQYWINKGLVH